MKILLLTHHWGRKTHHSKSSGYERLAYYLADYGHEIDVLVPGNYDTEKRVKKNLKIITRKVPGTNFLFEERLFLSYKALRLKKKYNIAHALYSDVGLFPTFKFPTVVTEHISKEVNDKSLWLNYKSILQKTVFARCVSVIAVSDNLRNILEKNYKLKNKSFTVPHGIDTTVFHPIPLTQSLKKMKNNLLKNQKYLCLSCGVLGIDSKVFLDIAKKFPQVLFVVVGRKENTELANVIHAKSVTEKELINLYAIADFCFKPLKFATANNALLEAMAMGKVNITNKIPGVTDYLDESCGYLANSYKDFERIFIEAMVKKITNERKGKMARKRAEKEFSWGIIAPRIIDIYNKSLKRKI